jgi:phage terminase large subunit-like protein
VILMVPQDEVDWPTLGPQVCDFIEQNLVFGPGDLRGTPAVVDDEKRGLIYRFYEVFPQGHPQAGRRRFKRCGVSLPKGTAKTELAAWIVACELHAEGPVRCTGWTKGGDPIGGPVTDPYIAMVAYTEEQSDELAYTALKVMLEEGPLKNDFDIGLDRIMRLKGDGIAQSLAGSPNARDGARTTFQHFDETHRFVLPRLKDAHKVMQANLPKRKLADAWSLETTTAFEPGLGSVAEATMAYAQSVADGLTPDTSLFFFHRHGSDEHDYQTAEGFRAAVIEASGPSAAWRDIDAIVGLWQDPTSDRAYLERVYANRLTRGATQAFDVVAWKELERKDSPVKDGAAIALGFDGAMFHDSTGLVGTEIETGYQWVVGAWEHPGGAREWQVPAEEVDALVEATFKQFNVIRLYADPPYWQSWTAKWAGADWSKDAEGKSRVMEWWTNRRKAMTYALNNFDTAIREGTIHHSGDARMTRHIGNSRRKDLPGERDEQGKPLWLIQKERPDSPQKIDLAMAAVLSWEARTDAIAAGLVTVGEPQLFFVGGKA